MEILIEKIVYDEVLQANRIVKDFFCLDKILQASYSDNINAIVFLCKGHYPSQNEPFEVWLYTEPNLKEILFCDNPFYAIEIASTHERMKPSKYAKMEENFQKEMFDFIRKNRFFKYEITLYDGETYGFSNKPYIEYGFFTKEL